MKGSELSNLFEEHAEKLAVDPDESARYRSLSYKKVADLIAKTFGEKKVTAEAVAKLKVTDYMKGKILQTMELGRIKSSSQEKKTAKSADRSKQKAIVEELASHSGIGLKRAEEFYKAGVRKLDDLLEKKFEHLLTTEIKAFMEMNPLKTIPHNDIIPLEKAMLECAPLDLVFVGSYRRKKPFSSDVDIMLVEGDEKQDSSFKKVMACLTKIADRFLVYAEGPDKMSGIGDFSRLTKKKGNVFKVDIFRTGPNTKLPYLLYSTGSKENNVAMRGKAKRMGLLLNQNGLFKNEKRIDKNFTSEKDYYDVLELPYKNPEDR